MNLAVSYPCITSYFAGIDQLKCKYVSSWMRIRRQVCTQLILLCMLFNHIFLNVEHQMPDYCFFQQGKQTVVLERSDTDGTARLTEQGYEKQFEEVSAIDEKHALARFADIRREKRIDQHNFLAGAIAMPLIGILTAVAINLFRKK